MSDKQKPEDSQKSKKDWVFDKLKSTNVKIGIVIAFFVGYQELMPILKDVLGLTADNKALVEECKHYTDAQIDSKEVKAQMWLDILTNDVYKLNQRAYEDSIIAANKTQTFAVGLRADVNGIIHYRSKYNHECSVRLNHDTHNIEFKSFRRDEWLPILVEDLDL